VHDAPDYGILGGNPAKLIRKRFTDEEIERLLVLAWWDWPIERVTAHIAVLMAESIEELERIASAAR